MTQAWQQTVNLERYYPRPGENAALRWQLMGYVAHALPIAIPFESREDAARYARERGWRVLDGLTMRS